MPNAFYANQPDYIEKLNALWDAAFGDFSVPLSAKGDLLTYNGTAVAILGAGADGEVLTADAAEPTGLKWAPSSGGSGSVSSVAISVPAFLSVSGSPITSSGTLAVSFSGTALPVANGGTGGTSASAARTALGLAIGTNVQAQDSELQAIADLTSSADKVPYFTGSGAASLADFTSLARTIAACTTAAQVRTAIGAASTAGGTETAASLGDLIVSANPKPTPIDSDHFGYADSENGDILVSFSWLDAKGALQDYFDTVYQPVDAELSALAGLASAADKLPYFTGSGTAALTTMTAFARSILDDADAAAVRATIGAGSGTGDVVGPASAVNNRVVFFDGTTGKLIKDSGLTLSGSNTGDQTTVSGNAGTATALQTARTIGGVSFDGTANITQPVVPTFFYPGVPTASVLVGTFVAPSGITTLTFAAAIAGSSGKALTAATAQTDFDVRKNATTSAGGSSVGTVRFAASGTVPTFIAASGFTLTGGTDFLTVWGPASPDASLANIAISLYGTR